MSAGPVLPASPAASGLHVDSAHPGDDVEMVELIRSGVRAGRTRHALEWGFSAIAAFPLTMWVEPLAWWQVPIAYALLAGMVRIAVAPAALAPLRLMQHQILTARCHAAGIPPRGVRVRVAAVLAGKLHLPSDGRHDP